MTLTPTTPSSFLSWLPLLAFSTLLSLRFSFAVSYQPADQAKTEAEAQAEAPKKVGLGVLEIMESKLFEVGV